jgi:hypothetical protein
MRGGGSNINVDTHPVMMTGNGQQQRSNSLLRTSEAARGHMGQIRSSMDMVRVYNYGPQSLQSSNPSSVCLIRAVY